MLREVTENANLVASPHASLHYVRLRRTHRPALAHDLADQLVELLTVVDELNGFEPALDLLPLALDRDRGIGGITYQSLMEQQRKSDRRPLGARAELRKSLHIGQVCRRSPQN